MTGQLRVGCAMWQHNDWPGSQLDRIGAGEHSLNVYARTFHAVEGNTTFYALPNEETSRRWAQAVPLNFRFLFKVQRTITHEKRFRSIDAEMAAFVQAVEPLQANLGPIMLQLPASFGPEQLELLTNFLDQTPADMEWAVEVRHQQFFERDQERRLNDALHLRGVNRITLDSRALFEGPAQTPGEIEAFQAKPRVPVRAVATASQPVVRFIGRTDLAANDPYLEPWVDTVVRWVLDGKNPTVFLHTPDNAEAPELVRRFYDAVSAALVAQDKQALEPLPPRPEPDAPSLF